MSSITYPDYIDAFVSRLRASALMTSVVSPSRIVTEIPSGTGMGKHNHLVVVKSGRAIPLPPRGTIGPRIDLMGFGTTGHESTRIVRAALSTLIPIHGDTRFEARGVIVDSVEEDGGFIQMETAQNWPYVVVSISAVVLRAPSTVAP